MCASQSSKNQCYNSDGCSIPYNDKLNMNRPGNNTIVAYKDEECLKKQRN